MTEIPPGAMFRDLPFLPSPEGVVTDEGGGPLLLDDEAGAGFNPPMDGVSSAFFVELDANTQFWDVYDLMSSPRYMQLVGVANPAVVAWQRLAVATTAQARQQAEQALMSVLTDSSVVAAIDDLDHLMVSLVSKHFPTADGGIDADAYLSVVEAFARDVLPDDEDRLSRITDKDPDDPRARYALRHTMDGPFMWFIWAAVVDVATMLDESRGTQDRRSANTAILAGSAAGSALDYAFRGRPEDPRGKTRPEYHADEATLHDLRASARLWAADLDKARTNARDLARIAQET